VVTKEPSESRRQRFTVLVDKEHQQDREGDDESVSRHELPERLRRHYEHSRVGPLRPHRQSARIREIVPPTARRPGPDQRQVLQPLRNRDPPLVRGRNFQDQGVRFGEQRSECEH